MSDAIESAAGALLGRVLHQDLDRRYIVGIAGPPGSGKSTIAAALVEFLVTNGVHAVVLPMDGFHLANTTLVQKGIIDRKGAPDTFDPLGYLGLLKRIRAESGETIYAPGFERTLEQPIAASITIAPEVQVVVTEGNYLLLDTPPWSGVVSELDERWFVVTDHDTRRARLRRRHEDTGKTPEAAARWIEAVDEPNAALVESVRHRAQYLIPN